MTYFYHPLAPSKYLFTFGHNFDAKQPRTRGYYNMLWLFRTQIRPWGSSFMAKNVIKTQVPRQYISIIEVKCRLLNVSYEGKDQNFLASP